MKGGAPWAGGRGRGADGVAASKVSANKGSTQQDLEPGKEGLALTIRRLIVFFLRLRRLKRKNVRGLKRKVTARQTCPSTWTWFFPEASGPGLKQSVGIRARGLAGRAGRPGPVGQAWAGLGSRRARPAGGARGGVGRIFRKGVSR